MPAYKGSHDYETREKLKRVITINERNEQRKEAKTAWEQGYKGADTFLSELYESGGLRDEYELKANGNSYYSNGKFTTNFDELMFGGRRGRKLTDFTHDSVIALAESLGYVVQD
jgi:hypothetical protein